MDEELEAAKVHRHLDYVVHWRGLTFRHIGFTAVGTMLAAYFSFFFPGLGVILPPQLVLALGVGAIVAMAIVQWRQEPEYFDRMLQKWGTPRHLSPFMDTGREVEFPIDPVAAWSEEEV